MGKEIENRIYHPVPGHPEVHIQWTAGGELRQPHKTDSWAKLDYWLILSPCNSRYEGETRQGVSLEATGDDVILIPPGTEYALSLVNPGNILAAGLYFRFYQVLDMSCFYSFPLVLKKSKGQEITNILELLCKGHREQEESLNCQSQARMLKTQVMLKKAGYELFAAMLTQGVAKGWEEKSYAAFTRILPAVEYINNHYLQIVSRNMIGEILGLSPQRTHVLFKDALGVAPGEYIRSVRLKYARLALEDVTKSIAQVALDFNYCDPFHFSKQFKKNFGYSPRLYREGWEKDLILGRAMAL